jgi:2,3,4,5-tetrahydropyridine-2-carboxylate N-succinyltransferase
LSVEELRAAVEELAGMDDPPLERAAPAVKGLLDALEAGEIRAASTEDGEWKVHLWVKRGVLLAFRIGANRSGTLAPYFHFRDRETLPTWSPDSCDRSVRLVPGGTTVRRGAYLGDDVVVMPPAYINVAAYVGDGSMVDSHALVGSCAQVGNNVHLSAAAQVGGVLEPIGAQPVIIEDEVFVGGGAGIYEGTRVGRGAVLAPGVVLTRAVPLFDLVREQVLRGTARQPLAVPEGAVVVPGARPAAGRFARQRGLQLQTPLIVKYRDRSTDAALALEEALR